MGKKQVWVKGKKRKGTNVVQEKDKQIEVRLEETRKWNEKSCLKYQCYSVCDPSLLAHQSSMFVTDEYI